MEQELGVSGRDSVRGSMIVVGVGWWAGFWEGWGLVRLGMG